MARIKTAISFSSHFGIKSGQLKSLGVIDPYLNIDAKLFIDPMLLSESTHEEMREATNSYRKYYTNLLKLLLNSSRRGDVAWRNAERLFSGKEIRGTSLGYGNSGISGSSLSASLRERLLITAKEVVELGIRDPDLFAALALFEEDVGPDYIGDITTKAILSDLCKFNQKVYSKLNVPLEEFHIEGCTGHFPVNPIQPIRTPIILIPRDIVRDLPIASDWDGVCHVAAWNAELRNRINQHLGDIFSKSAQEKQLIRAAVMRDRESFMTLLSTINAVDKKAYDIESDPEGEYVFHSVDEKIRGIPLKLQLPSKPSIDDVVDVAKTICEHYKELIENNGLSKDLWKQSNKVPANEKKAQRLFFAIADSYCRANNLDLSPESDSGVGPVDFKLSSGYDERALVEVKLSTNSYLFQGYEKQLEAYKGAEKTLKAIYLVIDVGKMGRKIERIFKLRNSKAKEGLPVSEVILVDGFVKPSASKRH